MGGGDPIRRSWGWTVALNVDRVLCMLCVQCHLIRAGFGRCNWHSVGGRPKAEAQQRMGWRREPRRWAGGAGFAEGCDDWGVVGGCTDHVPLPGTGPWARCPGGSGQGR